MGIPQLSVLYSHPLQFLNSTPSLLPSPNSVLASANSMSTVPGVHPARVAGGARVPAPRRRSNSEQKEAEAETVEPTMNVLNSKPDVEQSELEKAEVEAAHHDQRLEQKQNRAEAAAREKGSGHHGPKPRQ